MKKIGIFLLTLSALYAEKQYGEVVVNGGSALKDSFVTLLLSVIMLFYPLTLALGTAVMRFPKLAKNHFEKERQKIDEAISKFLTHDVITLEIDQDSIELQKEIDKTKKALRRLS